MTSQLTYLPQEGLHFMELVRFIVCAGYVLIQFSVFSYYFPCVYDS
jgi:hypothetical protein